MHGVWEQGGLLVPRVSEPKTLRLLSCTHLKCCQDLAYYLALQHDPGFSLHCDSIAAGMLNGIGGGLISA